MVAVVKDWEMLSLLDVITTDSATNMLGNLLNKENFPDNSSMESDWNGGVLDNVEGILDRKCPVIYEVCQQFK